MVVGRLLPYWASVTFQGQTVELRGGMFSKVTFSISWVLPCLQLHLIPPLGPRSLCAELGMRNSQPPAEVWEKTCKLRGVFRKKSGEQKKVEKMKKSHGEIACDCNGSSIFSVWNWNFVVE